MIEAATGPAEDDLPVVAKSSIMIAESQAPLMFWRGMVMSSLPHSSEIPRCESIEDVIQNFGDLNQLAAEMDSLRELAISVEGRRNELISEHPDQWVAVSKDGVVAAARTRRELFELLEEQRIRPDDVYHDYLDTNPRTLLL